MSMITVVWGWAFDWACFTALFLGLFTLASTHDSFISFFIGMDAIFFVWVLRKQDFLLLRDTAEIFACCVILGFVLRERGVWIWLAGQWMSGPGYNVH